MYVVEIRLYQDSVGWRAYAEAYEGQPENGKVITSAHIWTPSTERDPAFGHPDIQAAIEAVCHELSQNSPYLLF